MKLLNLLAKDRIASIILPAVAILSCFDFDPKFIIVNALWVWVSSDRLRNYFNRRDPIKIQGRRKEDMFI